MTPDQIPEVARAARGAVMRCAERERTETWELFDLAGASAFVGEIVDEVGAAGGEHLGARLATLGSLDHDVTVRAVLWRQLFHRLARTQRIGDYAARLDRDAAQRVASLLDDELAHWRAIDAPLLDCEDADLEALSAYGVSLLTYLHVRRAWPNVVTAAGGDVSLMIEWGKRAATELGIDASWVLPPGP